ncbi:unnamed protein product [Amoebophrya sp. A120]|nr:unnamed protein product [Amoebophrya sp. A120]|eukprot:GSA120T00021799001.1
MPELEPISANKTSSDPADSTTTKNKSDRIWEEHGDKVVIQEFHKLMFPDPEKPLSECLPRNISARCAEVWNGHHVAYRCLTCGISPSSCICVACFNAGEHEGHDYFIYRSDYGGCCDCGDADAWDVCGFCRYHRMAYEANKRNPCTNLPPKIKNTLRNILPIQLRRLCHHLQEWTMSSNNSTGNIHSSTEIPSECSEHIKFLLKLAGAHDGLRHIISEAFAKQEFNGKSILEFALQVGSNHLAKETDLTNLFLDLMFDANFKRTFARIFLKLYPDLILNRSEVLSSLVDENGEDAENIHVGADPTSLDRVTVQLFSIRAITLELLEDPDVELLDTLLRTTKDLLLLACDQKSKVKYLVNNHSILTKRSYFQCTHDLRFVLDHQEVVDELFARMTFRNCLWQGWLEIWKIIQCANPHVRIPEDADHVAHENTRWGNSLVFESDIHSASSSMIVTLENRVRAIDTVHWALIPLCKALREWISTVRSAEQNWYIALCKPDPSLNERIAKFTPEEEEIGLVGCDYVVSKQPVSFHIPMHRIFASLMHCVCSSPNETALIKEKDSKAAWATGDRATGMGNLMFGTSANNSSSSSSAAGDMNEAELLCEPAGAPMDSTPVIDRRNEDDQNSALNSSKDVDMLNDNENNNNDTGVTTPVKKKSTSLIIDTNMSPPPANESRESASKLFAQIVNSPKKTPAEKKKPKTHFTSIDGSTHVSSYLARLERDKARDMATTSLYHGGGIHTSGFGATNLFGGGFGNSSSSSSATLNHLELLNTHIFDPFKDSFQLFKNTESLFKTVLQTDENDELNIVDLLHIMEHPLRCLVFHAQCYGFSSLWLRNGDSVAYEACFYKKNYWHSLFVDPDLTLIRLVMLALSETNHLSAFVATVLQRFEAGPRLVGHSVETMLLTLCQCLAIEPYTFRANDVERITEYHCIHVLAKGPCTHSELTDTIMKSHDNSDFLDGILSDIADFQEPDAATQSGHRTPGKYILKQALWRYVDPLFLLYSWKEQHDVEERKLEKLGAKLSNSFVPNRHWKDIESFVVPCYRKGLQLIAREPAFISVPIVSLLQTAFLPLEMVNHRGLQLTLLLLQRLLVLVNFEEQKEKMLEDNVRNSSTSSSTTGNNGNKIIIQVSVVQAGNVFALAKELADKVDPRLSMVDVAKDVVVEVDCCEVSSNCLARQMMRIHEQSGDSLLSRPGTSQSSRNTGNSNGTGDQQQQQPPAQSLSPSSPSRRQTARRQSFGLLGYHGLKPQLAPLTLDNNPLSSAAVVHQSSLNIGTNSSTNSSSNSSPNNSRRPSLTNNGNTNSGTTNAPGAATSATSEGKNVLNATTNALAGGASSGATSSSSRILNGRSVNLTRISPENNDHQELGGELEQAMEPEAMNVDQQGASSTAVALKQLDQSSSVVQFSLLQCFEAILKEPSCKQHVHVVNQNLNLLQLYGVGKEQPAPSCAAMKQSSGTSTSVVLENNSADNKPLPMQAMRSGATESTTASVNFGSMALSSTNSIGFLAQLDQAEAGAGGSCTSLSAGVAAPGGALFQQGGAAPATSSSSYTAFQQHNEDAPMPQATQEEPVVEEKTEAEKKKEERKRKQAAMLKKFNKKQKTFLEDAAKNSSPVKKAASVNNSQNATPTLNNTGTSAVASNNGAPAAVMSSAQRELQLLQQDQEPGSSKKAISTSKVDLICQEIGEPDVQEAECVICFCQQPGEKTGQNPLGRMAHLQKTCVSNVPRLKKLAVSESQNSPTKTGMNNNSSNSQVRKRKRLSPQKSCPVDPQSAAMFNSGAGGVSSTTSRGLFVGQQVASSSSSTSKNLDGDVTMGGTTTSNATTIPQNQAAQQQGSLFQLQNVSGSSSSSSSKEKTTAGSTGGANQFSSAAPMSNNQLSRWNSVPAAPTGQLFPQPGSAASSPEKDSNYAENNLHANSPVDSNSSSEESSAYEQGLEDPNLKRKLLNANNSKALELIEQLQPDPTAAGLYMWSCSHKIHFDCWRRLRHGTMHGSRDNHCPYCNHPVHIFIPCEFALPQTLKKIEEVNNGGAVSSDQDADGDASMGVVDNENNEQRIDQQQQQQQLQVVSNKPTDALEIMHDLMDPNSQLNSGGRVRKSIGDSGEVPSSSSKVGANINSSSLSENEAQIALAGTRAAGGAASNVDPTGTQIVVATRKNTASTPFAELQHLENWDQFFKSSVGYQQLALAMMASRNVSWSLKCRAASTSPFYSFLDWVQNERQNIRAQYCLIPPSKGDYSGNSNANLLTQNMSVAERRRMLNGLLPTVPGGTAAANVAGVATGLFNRFLLQQQQNNATAPAVVPVGTTATTGGGVATTAAGTTGTTTTGGGMTINPVQLTNLFTQVTNAYEAANINDATGNNVDEIVAQDTTTNTQVEHQRADTTTTRAANTTAGAAVVELSREQRLRITAENNATFLTAAQDIQRRLQQAVAQHGNDPANTVEILNLYAQFLTQVQALQQNVNSINTRQLQVTITTNNAATDNRGTGSAAGTSLNAAPGVDQQQQQTGPQSLQQILASATASAQALNNMIQTGTRSSGASSSSTGGVVFSSTTASINAATGSTASASSSSAPSGILTAAGTNGASSSSTGQQDQQAPIPVAPRVFVSSGGAASSSNTAAAASSSSYEDADDLSFQVPPAVVAEQQRMAGYNTTSDQQQTGTASVSSSSGEQQPKRVRTDSADHAMSDGVAAVAAASSSASSSTAVPGSAAGGSSSLSSSTAGRGTAAINAGHDTTPLGGAGAANANPPAVFLEGAPAGGATTSFQMNLSSGPPSENGSAFESAAEVQSNASFTSAVDSVVGVVVPPGGATTTASALLSRAPPEGAQLPPMLPTSVSGASISSLETPLVTPAGGSSSAMMNPPAVVGGLGQQGSSFMPASSSSNGSTAARAAFINVAQPTTAGASAPSQYIIQPSTTMGLGAPPHQTPPQLQIMQGVMQGAPGSSLLQQQPSGHQRKSESETMRMVMKSLASHPATILGSVLADQIRLDEIRLRAKGQHQLQSKPKEQQTLIPTLEPKRLEFLRNLADTLRSYSKMNSTDQHTVFGAVNGPQAGGSSSPSNRNRQGNSAGVTAAAAAAASGARPLMGGGTTSAGSSTGAAGPSTTSASSAMIISDPTAASSSSSSAPAPGFRDHPMDPVVNNVGSASVAPTTILTGGSAASSSSKNPNSELQFPSATELLFRKIICTAIPCDPSVLHEWITVASIHNEQQMHPQAVYIALVHTLKLIFMTLEREFEFLKIPYFAPKFQRERIFDMKDLYDENPKMNAVGGAVAADLLNQRPTPRPPVMSVNHGAASGGAATSSSASGSTISGTTSAGATAAQLQNNPAAASGGVPVPAPFIMKSMSSESSIALGVTEDSGASNAENESSSCAGGVNRSVLGGPFQHLQMQQIGNNSSSRPGMQTGDEMQVDSCTGDEEISGVKMNHGASTADNNGADHDDAALESSCNKTNKDSTRATVSDSLNSILNSSEMSFLNKFGPITHSFEDQEEEDLFQLFDEEDKHAREELRKEKNELRRSAEFFELTEQDTKNLVGVALLPFLRRILLLQNVLGVRDTTATTGEDRSTEEAGLQKKSSLTMKNNFSNLTTWEHACLLVEMISDKKIQLDNLLRLHDKQIENNKIPDYVWKKMQNAQDKWFSSTKVHSRALIEFLPTLNQKAFDTVTKRDIPYLRPKFAKNSKFIRLSAKQDYANLLYQKEYRDHHGRKNNTSNSSSSATSFQMQLQTASLISSQYKTKTTTPYSVLLQNRCFFLEIHCLGYGKTDVRQWSESDNMMHNSIGAMAASSSCASANNVNGGTSSAAALQSATIGRTSSVAGGPSQIVPTTCNYNHNLGVLIKLPYLYQTLYTTYIHKQCPLCFPPNSSNVNQPKISFLCLLTGKHLCSANTFMEQYGVVQAAGGSVNCPNSFTKHAGKTGLGLSVLINLLSGLVHVQKDDRMCVWGAIYLDAYGEEDRYLSRGKPLYLSQARLQQLTNAIASHSFESDTKLIWKQLN